MTLTAGEVGLVGMVAVFTTGLTTTVLSFRHAKRLAEEAREGARSDWWRQERLNTYDAVLEAIDAHDHWEDDLYRRHNGASNFDLTDEDAGELERLSAAVWATLSRIAIRGPAAVEKAGTGYAHRSLARTLEGPLPDVTKARATLLHEIQVALGTPDPGS